MLVSFTFSWLSSWLPVTLKPLFRIKSRTDLARRWLAARRRISPCMEGLLRCAGVELLCWCTKSISLSSVPKHEVQRCFTAADAQACIQQDISPTPCSFPRNFREQLLPSGSDGKIASDSWGFYCAPEPGIRWCWMSCTVWGWMQDVWGLNGIL